MTTSNFEELAQECVVIESRTYTAIMKRDADGNVKIYPVPGQTNNPMWCTEFSMERRANQSINSVINEMIIHNGRYDDADIILAAPFSNNFDKNEPTSFVLMHGLYVKENKPDHKKPIFVKGERTVESVYDAISNAVKRTFYTKPFIFLLPEHRTTMYDVCIRFVPNEAIKNQVDVDESPTNVVTKDMQNVIDTETTVNLDSELHSLIREIINGTAAQQTQEDELTDK